MRILAIRGANLASLTTFDLDLTADPLAGAGLFAITGDTGAGKSTMLDALCLALYGEYPRAAVGRREDVPDPSGDTLSVQDARNILRRGTASGFAEVDFIGQDGVSYRSRWEARRARGKADGKPQKEERRLDRLDGSQTVASGKTDVLAAVVDKTGLTFDQFRRTVLLAQGEFDAFLLADEKARAELLEKITGTDIYRRISQSVNAAATKRQNAIATLDAALGAVAFLDQPVRTTLQSEAAESEALALAKATEREHLSAKLLAAKRQTEARALLAEAETALAVADAASTAAAEDRKKLILLDKLSPVSSKFAASQAATDDHTKAEATLKATDALMRDAQLVSGTAMMGLQKAKSAATAAQKLFAAEEPLWREAEALDIEIATAKREFDAACAIAAKARDDGLAAKTALEKMASERTSIRDTLARLTVDLEATSAHAAIADRGREISRLLMRYDESLGLSSKAAEDASKARAEVQRLATAAGHEQRTATEARTRREAMADSLKSRRAALAAADNGTIEVQDRALALLQDKTREAEQVAHAWRQAELDIQHARETASVAKAAMDRSEEQRQNAETEAERRMAARRDISSLADLADASLTEAAEALRQALEPGQSCPVCGSKAHPFVDHSGSGRRLVLEIAGRREALDGEIDQLSRQVSELSAAKATAKAQFEEAQRRAAIAHTDKSRLAQTYAALAKPLTGAITACRLSHLVPAALDQRTAHALAQIGADATRARSHFEQTLKRTHDLRHDVDTLQQAVDDLARMREAAEDRLKSITAERLDAERRLAATESRANETTRVLTDLTGTLAPHLATVGATADDLARDARAVEMRINEQGALYKVRRAERDKLDGRLQSFAVEEAAAAATFAAAETTAKTATVTAEAREARHAEMSAQRATLLGGRPTDSHRQAALATLTSAQAASAAASAELETRALEHALAADRQQAMVDGLKLAAERRTATRAALAAAVEDLGLAWSEVEALMALPSDTKPGLSEKLSGLARALTDAQNTRDLRRADLASLTAAGDLAIDLVETEATIAQLRQEDLSARDRASAIKTKLGMDAEARHKAGSIAVEIDTARADYTVWQAVDTAIGSASGDKFRRIAQSVTLDHLVQLANLQLEQLNPRYRLQRSSTGDLGLAVVDRDMGDELRAVRSLSGGERFLVSLALALALSGLEGRQSFVDTLFIDEGFGALDAETLDTAIDALEMLQSHGRKVGVITHVAAMIDRITVQIRVEKRGNGRSTVRITQGESIAA